MNNSPNLYEPCPKHYVALDNIIFGFDEKELKILLIKRSFEPEKGNWSLMGGFLKDEEGVDEAATRVLYELTGLRNVFVEQLHTYGAIHRDPVARTVSVAYYALIRVNDYDTELGKKYGARWFPIHNYPSLIFDHPQMVQDALDRLRSKTRTQPIGFELLPEKFTIPQLRHLYEAIHNQVYDPRNFSRKLNSMKLLIQLHEKDKENSKKGAYLYKFDPNRYKMLLSQGFSFEL
ncbi:MAG: NUDIX domain-containing protein [Microscillaceae bacterium]|nr:NUDIX domain-containing protein [Microscillaceae bacterium]